METYVLHNDAGDITGAGIVDRPRDDVRRDGSTTAEYIERRCRAGLKVAYAESMPKPGARIDAGVVVYTTLK